jgi:hypothetical protein
MPIAGRAAALSIRVMKHSSDVESIQWRSSTTNRNGRRWAPLRMSWRSASKVRALMAEVVSVARASVPSEMPNRRSTYGRTPAGSIPICRIPSRIFPATTSALSPSASRKLDRRMSRIGK